MQAKQLSQLRDGSGIVNILDVVPCEDLPEKCRMFSVVTLQKGCSIGRHDHQNETEVYYVLEGEGVLDDNGKQTKIQSGECTLCGPGQYHAISNQKDVPLIFVAAIILE